MPSWGSGGNQTAGSGLGGGNIGGKGGKGGSKGAAGNDKDKDGVVGGTQYGRGGSGQPDNALGGGGGGRTPGRVMNDTTATQQIAEQAGVSPTEYENAVGAYANRVRDYLDTDNSFVDDLGNVGAGMLGFNEMEP